MTTTTEAKAVENIAANKFDHIPGFTPNPGAGADDFEVGQLVSIHSRGYYRLAIVDSIGKKNLKAVFTTEGAVTEAYRRRDLFLEAGRTVEAHVAKATEQGRKNWDYYALEATVDSFAARFPGQYPAEKVEKDKAEKRAFRAENPDRDAWGEAAGAAHRENIERNAEAARNFDLAKWVNFTRKAVKFSEVGVR